MRFVAVLALLLLYTSVLEASYARSIRLSSFTTKAKANKALVELENFIESNDRLVEIQEDQGFHLSVIKSGKYYMHSLEPFTNKKLVQETLDILRTKYSYVYPRKIKFKPEYLVHKKKSYERAQDVSNAKEEQEEAFESASEVTPEKVQSRDDIEIAQPIKKEMQNIDREKLLKKVNNVLQTNDKVKDETMSREYPSLGLRLPTLQYSALKDAEVKYQEKTKRELKDFSAAPMTIFRSYMLEILLFAGFIILSLIIAIIYKYKKTKENRITIQEIYN